MSRIGKLPIQLPTGVQVQVASNNEVSVKGKLGELKRAIDPDIKVDIEGSVLTVTRPTEQKRHKALHGLYRALINNMVVGVSEGYKKQMEVVGVGFKATANGQKLELSLGFSHDIILELPSEVKVEAVTDKGKAPLITLTSFDKELLGKVAAKIRSFRPPEPYKGKGVLFAGEKIRRKAGKTAGA